MTPMSVSSRNRLARNCSIAAVALVAITARPASAGVTRAKVVGQITAPSGNLRDARLVGPSGQLYLAVNGTPNVWRRETLGGVAATVRFAGHHNQAIFAAGQRAPLYVLRNGVWHAWPLPNRGRACLATSGPVGAASMGRQVYVFASKTWRRFGKTKGRITSVWAANTSTVYVANSRGRLRRGRKTGKRATWTLLSSRLPRGDFVSALVGKTRKHLYAISDGGVLLHVRNTRVRRVATPPGMLVRRVAFVANDQVIIAGRIGAAVVVARLSRGRVAKPIHVADIGKNDRVTALIYTHEGHQIVVTQAGMLFVQSAAGLWRRGVVHGGEPRPSHTRFPRAAPARTR